MNNITLEKMINNGLHDFSEDLNVEVLKGIADKSLSINILGKCEKTIPDVFTTLINTYDQILNLNKCVGQVFIYDSEIKPLQNTLEDCSIKIFTNKEDYERIKILSNNCQKYSTTILSNVARAMQLYDRQRAESSEKVKFNMNQALSELSKISFTPLNESNFEELDKAIEDIREKHLYDKNFTSTRCFDSSY